LQNCILIALKRRKKNDRRINLRRNDNIDSNNDCVYRCYEQMILRPYQEKLYLDVRVAFRGRRTVCMQLQTGGGKTVIFARMVQAAYKKGSVVWVIVPRKELLEQASEKLAQNGIPHGQISSGIKESKAYQVHIVSKDTLIRRLDKIKTEPDFIIIDEAHIALDRYLEFSGRFSSAKILGVTATPERLDGRGLSELYETLVLGPPMKSLIEKDYLTNVRYFAPPTPGIENLHRIGTEYKTDELLQLLEKRKIYGKAIDHYRKYAHKKPCLVYCRSVKAAKETAYRFSAAGYRFENIDGAMPKKRRKALLDGLRTGDIDGLASCDLITYGLDVPRVECIVMLRPTLSRTLYCQMIGRGLRPSPGKQECIVLDHVGNLQEHGHPLLDHEWKFDGREKRGRRSGENQEINIRLCPEADFIYCDKPSCAGCQHNRTGRTVRDLTVVDTELGEVKNPVKLAHRAPEEKREIQDQINDCVKSYNATGSSGPVRDLIELGEQIGRQAMWVYHLLCEGRETVNVPLLFEIQKIKGYKHGWAYFKRKELREKMVMKNANKLIERIKDEFSV